MKIFLRNGLIITDSVASFAEAWIEKQLQKGENIVMYVASFAEAWIEKSRYKVVEKNNMSPPSRRRGLKND